MSHELKAGDEIDGRFKIIDVINRSGMGSIYQATDLKTNEKVALKVPLLQFESDPAFFFRFEREADIGYELDKHPHILRFIKVEGKKSRPYIVTEYLDGQTLAQVLAKVRPLPVADSVQICARICDALEYMHKHGVIHRDLKPQNIMICSDGSLRVMDFGIAKAAEMRRVTFVGFSPPMGTPDYMAPELVKGRRGDEKTDIYELGAMLYEMTTGVLPFEGENPFLVMNARLSGDPAAPRKVNPKIPPELEEIILHAMERDPRKRYASATEMKAELNDLDSVKVTGRYKHLKTPKVWMSHWHGMRLVVFSAVTPLLVFLVFYLLSRGHGGHH